MTNRLSGKVAVVTGSGSGIGQGSALRLARDGAKVVIADISPTRAQETVTLIEEAGGVASAFEVDVAEEESVRALIAETVARYGSIDLLHNNAAAIDQSRIEGAYGVVDLPTEIWDRSIDVNLRGYMYGCKYAVPRMIERGGGSIVNTSSVVSFAPLPVQTAYASSKGGVNALTKAVATSYGKQGVRCNAICPGFIVTPTTEDAYPDEFRAKALAVMPATRLGRPEDIAALVSFLGSDDAEFITGQIIAVDGGITTAGALYSYLTSGS